MVIIGAVKPLATAPLVRITDDSNNSLVSSTDAQTATEPNAEGWRVWTVTVALPPGNYTIDASTQIEGPDGRPRSASENKNITVLQ